MGHRHPGTREPASARLAVLTVSDTRTPGTDASGARARALIEQAGHRVTDYRLIPDEPRLVREAVNSWIDSDGCDGVIVTGGTGISGRDRTYEAVADLLDKRLDGFGELFRFLSYEDVGSAAMLSRAVAGVARGKVVFSVPGSTPAVELALGRLILPEIRHLLGELRKGPVSS